jgi:hypothetical protein
MFFVQQLYQKSLITMHNQRVIIAERALINLIYIKNYHLAFDIFVTIDSIHQRHFKQTT